MKTRKKRDYTKQVVERSGNRTLRVAYQSGKLVINGAPAQRKFWIEKCPPELWKEALEAAEDTLGYKPLI